MRLVAQQPTWARSTAMFGAVLDGSFDEAGAESSLTIRSASLEPARGGQPGSTRRPRSASSSWCWVHTTTSISTRRWSTATGRRPGTAPVRGAVSEYRRRSQARRGLHDCNWPTLQPRADVVVAGMPQIIGVWANSRSDAYWLGDRLDLDGEVEAATITRGPVIVAPKTSAHVGEQNLDLQWQALLVVENISSSSMDAVNRSALHGLIEAALPVGRSVTTNVALADVLGVDRSVVVGRSGVVLVVLQFVVLAGYAVLRRRTSGRATPARGSLCCGRGWGMQVGLLAIARSLALAIPATLLAVVAFVVVDAIGSVGAVGESGIVAAPTPASRIALTVLAGLAAVVVLSVPALLADVDLAHVRAALGPTLGRTTAQRIGLDVVLVAVTIIGLVQLQTCGSPVAGDAQPGD